MHSILEAFANGHISPEVQYFHPHSDYGRTIATLSSTEEQLLRLLEGEEKALFERFSEAQGALNQQTAVKNLIYGYKLGLLMTAEAFITSGDLTGEESV